MLPTPLAYSQLRGDGEFVGIQGGSTLMVYSLRMHRLQGARARLRQVQGEQHPLCRNRSAHTKNS